MDFVGLPITSPTSVSARLGLKERIVKRKVNTIFHKSLTHIRPKYDILTMLSQGKSKINIQITFKRFKTHFNYSEEYWPNQDICSITINLTYINSLGNASFIPNFFFNFFAVKPMPIPRHNNSTVVSNYRHLTYKC